MLFIFLAASTVCSRMTEYLEPSRVLIFAISLAALPSRKTADLSDVVEAVKPRTCLEDPKVKSGYLQFAVREIEREFETMKNAAKGNDYHHW
jgi:hypothetical protein